MRLHAFSSLVVSVVVAALSRPALAGAADTRAVGDNLARGARYTLSPAPDYAHCTDERDDIQLTDGELTEGYFWTQAGTVGWRYARHVSIVIDLGGVQPIQGASFRTAAGIAGVFWPMAIRIHVSADGKNYREVGDLIELNEADPPPADSYGVHRYVTSKLRTHGRYVRFLCIPAGPYLFTDEIEVFRGPDSLLDGDPGGKPADDIEVVYTRYRVEAGIRRRFERDLQALKSHVESADLSHSDKEHLTQRVHAVAVGLEKLPEVQVPASFRTTLPFSDAHRELFAVYGELQRRKGHTGLHAWAAGPWDPLELFGNVKSPAGRIEVHTLRGEYRSAAINVLNLYEQPFDVDVHFEGLPGSPMPGGISVYEVARTDTIAGEPVAAALVEAPREDNVWQVPVLPGLLQQIWLSFHVTNWPSGEHAGAVILSAGEDEQRIPIVLHVYPLEFPKRATLWLGGWSYTDGDGRYGITPQNKAALIEHLRQRFVNAPWATAGVMMDFEFDETQQAIRLNTQRFDDWTRQWPDAAAYLVFLSVGKSFAGAALGSEDFDRRVGLWIKAWADHLKARQLRPGQLGLLLVDEPRRHEQDDVIIAWARAIKAAEPEILIWEDPIYQKPKDGRSEMYAGCDILCPNRPMWLSAGKQFADFYLDQQKQGRTLQLYSCSGPARLLDPYAYYRLQAWHCWQIGATGSFFWAFGDNSQSSSWNEYAAARNPYTPLFLDDRTVTPGKQMEAIRESVEDYEYFVMLQQAVRRAESAGRSGRLIEEARQLLESAADEVLSAEGVEGLRWQDPKDRGKADAVRVRMLQALTMLSAEPE